MSINRWTSCAVALIAIAAGACDTGQSERDAAIADSLAALAPGVAQTHDPALTAAAARLVVVSPRRHGDILADANGRALYMLEGEEEGASKCYDACAQTWPPLLAGPSGPPTAMEGSEIDQEKIGTIQRTDGTTQVTYDGKALYYYAQDTAPGETKGQDLTDQWGEWYLLRPDGEKAED